LASDFLEKGGVGGEACTAIKEKTKSEGAMTLGLLGKHNRGHTVKEEEIHRDMSLKGGNERSSSRVRVVKRKRLQRRRRGGGAVLEMEVVKKLGSARVGTIFKEGPQKNKGKSEKIY